jgi:PBP1b-binding outer membrane lipoprotein LpoB
MKTYSYCLSLIFFISACGETPKNSIEKTVDRSVVKASSQLYIPVKVKNFGHISKDTTLSYQYQLINTGKKEIHIREITPDCTCTGFNLTKKVLLPGDTSLLSLSLSTKEKYGETKLYATIETDTPVQFYRVGLFLDKQY